MTATETLQRLEALRDLMATGWTEPFCLDTAGGICALDAEMVQSFSLAAGLALVCRDDFEKRELWRALEAVAVPAHLAVEKASDVRSAVQACRSAGADESLEMWLESPKRTHAERMRLLTLAVAKAKAKARDERRAA